MSPALNRIKDSQIISALNTAWNLSHQAGNPNSTPLVAQGTDDDGILCGLNDRSKAATDFAHDFLVNYSDPTAERRRQAPSRPPASRRFTGAAAAALTACCSDPRVPDVIGIAQYGVVYTGHPSKIAEHGDHTEDRNVPILVARPDVAGRTAVTTPVETTQIAPTILKLLGLDPDELQAVRIEGTESLF